MLAHLMSETCTTFSRQFQLSIQSSSGKTKDKFATVKSLPPTNMTAKLIGCPIVDRASPLYRHFSPEVADHGKGCGSVFNPVEEY